MYLTVADIARFWEKISITDTCWFWMAGCNGDGYGALRVGSRGVDRRMVQAHHVAYFLHFGEIPNDMNILHQCDTPPCCRWSHLFPGTCADNNRDAAQKCRTRRTAIAPAIVEQIRELHGSGVSQVEIAKLLDLHKQNVWNVLHRLKFDSRAEWRALSC